MQFQFICYVKFTFTFLSILFLASCSHNASTDLDGSDPAVIFQGLVQEAIDDAFETVPGVCMSVLSPDLNINWTGCSGYDSKEKDQVLTADQLFRIASVTKTFVAASIMKLHEMDSLNIDHAISQYISDAHIDLLIKGGYDPKEITIRHCLNHTSGLYDYAMGGNTYMEMITKNPQKRWSRTEQIQLSMDTGAPVAKPGKVYRYSDTGYILLGEIIENLMRLNLGISMKILLNYPAVNIHSTWLESIEEIPSDLARPVRRYARRQEFTHADPSIDLWGGGGLISTTTDLANFISALFNNKVFENPETLTAMLEKPSYASDYNIDSDDRYKDYRQGLWQVDIYGEKGYMHGGLWGTLMFYIPAYDTAIAINYTHGRRDRLLKKTVLAIKKIHEKAQ